MVTAGQPSSGAIRPVGVVLTGLPLYCRPCQHCFTRILDGAVVRVKGAVWILVEDGYQAPPVLACPRCGRTDLYLRRAL